MLAPFYQTGRVGCRRRDCFVTDMQSRSYLRYSFVHMHARVKWLYWRLEEALRLKLNSYFCPGFGLIEALLGLGPVVYFARGATYFTAVTHTV